MVAEFLTFLSTKLSGTSLYIVVAVVGCVVMVPQVVKVWDSWKDFRSGKGELAMKKMELEVLKLRYEVEIMKDKLNRTLDAEIKILATPAPVRVGPRTVNPLEMFVGPVIVSEAVLTGTPPGISSP